MNNPFRATENENRLLSRLGGRYILRVQFTAQLLASIVGLTIGLTFIVIAANLNRVQTIELIVFLFIFILLENLLLPIYMSMITKRARARLDFVFNQRPLPEWDNDVLAWKEIIAFPGNSTLAQLMSAYPLVIIPVLLIMIRVGGVDWMQTIFILIGGSVAEIFIVIQTFFLLDRQLAPARRVLIPDNPSDQDIVPNFGQRGRHFFVSILLIVTSIFVIGFLGIHKIITLINIGRGQSTDLNQIIGQVGIMSIGIIAIGIFTTTLHARSATEPVHEMMRIMNLIQSGNYSERAKIMTSDESALLTIRLNQTLDQLQAAQIAMERQVKERTTALELRNIQLREATEIAHEATSYQDLNMMLAQTANRIAEKYNYYHVGIFLIDDSGEYAILQTASSEGGKNLQVQGYRVAVGSQNAIGIAAYQSRLRVASIDDSDIKFIINPELPLTRSEIAIPLIAKNKVIGVMDVQSTEKNSFSKDSIELLLTITDQIALAIQHAKTLSESQNVYKQLEALNTENVRRSWLERSRQQKRAYHYTSAGVAQITQGDGTQLASNSAITEDNTSRLEVPINLRGQRIGNIILNRKTETTWSEKERSLAIEIATQVGLALENSRLLEEAQRHAAQEQSLSELTARLSGSLDPDNLLQTTARELHQMPNVTEVSVFIAPSQSSADDKT
jgi:GAF domain-containing protein